jgi:hypothetical protein
MTPDMLYARMERASKAKESIQRVKEQWIADHPESAEARKAKDAEDRESKAQWSGAFSILKGALNLLLAIGSKIYAKLVEIGASLMDTGDQAAIHNLTGPEVNKYKELGKLLGLGENGILNVYGSIGSKLGDIRRGGLEKMLDTSSGIIDLTDNDARRNILGLGVYRDRTQEDVYNSLMNAYMSAGFKGMTLEHREGSVDPIQVADAKMSMASEMDALLGTEAGNVMRQYFARFETYVQDPKDKEKIIASSNPMQLIDKILFARRKDIEKTITPTEMQAAQEVAKSFKDLATQFDALKKGLLTDILIALGPLATLGSDFLTGVTQLFNRGGKTDRLHGQQDDERVEENQRAISISNDRIATYDAYLLEYRELFNVESAEQEARASAAYQDSFYIPDNVANEDTKAYRDYMSILAYRDYYEDVRKTAQANLDARNNPKFNPGDMAAAPEYEIGVVSKILTRQVDKASDRIVEQVYETTKQYGSTSEEINAAFQSEEYLTQKRVAAEQITRLEQQAQQFREQYPDEYNAYEFKLHHARNAYASLTRNERLATYTSADSELSEYNIRRAVADDNAHRAGWAMNLAEIASAMAATLSKEALNKFYSGEGRLEGRSEEGVRRAELVLRVDIDGEERTVGGVTFDNRGLITDSYNDLNELHIRNWEESSKRAK